MTRKICVVTSSRADYGLLRWLMQDIRNETDLTLQLVVTGMHLSPEFGLTYREIELDGFYINRKVEMLTSSDTEIGVIKSVGLGFIGFADALGELSPDLLIVLGDRFETFAAATSAYISKIPVAHLHGGELTEGAFDDSFRHSITKMSHLHFVANLEYKKRVIQLGEDPARVFLVGGLGVDALNRTKLMTKSDLEASIDFEFGSRNLLVSFHPVTLDLQSSCEQMYELLSALSELDGTNIIFTLPNADTEGRKLAEMVMNFVKVTPNARAYKSLGQLRYLSCLQFVDGVIGNSSSGLLEAPTIGVPTLNIGNRQKGRLSADSVIHCNATLADIRAGLKKIYDPSFRTFLPAKNPYGDGGASEKIINTIKHYDFNQFSNKRFYDL